MCNKTKAVAKTAKAPKSGHHLFLREQLDDMTGEDRKNYRSIALRRWKEVKEDPAKLSEYNDRARRMQNEAEESGDYSQNEKAMVDRPTAKQPKKVPKSTEFVSTDSDDEQGPVVEQLQKVPKTPEYSDDEQELTAKKHQKASKTPEYSDNEQGPPVKCIVMYSTEDEQEPVVKKTSKSR